ncbi:MAG TPA: hypothetical protein VJ044_17035, partial [Candidatus Hodarchaeales archaeon]|nr:hypothetical protein [Candidatus Hodarchaeales archaeon]
MEGELVSQIDAELQCFFGERLSEIEFEVLEQAIRSKVLQIAGRFVERQLNSDNSDYLGSSQPCKCGKMARYVGRRSK